MESNVLIFILLVGAGVCQHHQRRQLAFRQAQAPSPVLEELEERPKVYEVSHQISPNVGDGSFGYRSVLSNGFESESTGHFVNPLQSQVHEGSYTTTDEHGQVVRVNYIADKNGFRPVGQNGIPLVPTSPPEPVELIKAREDILRQQKTIRDQHLQHLRAGYAAHGL